MKRRKNAGEGYGYMFHGAFADKADAVKKEKQTKGAFIKGRPTPRGFRWIVMSPRTNPIKRKRVNPAGREILEQLGGNKFRSMTGAKDFVSTRDGLRFRLPSNFARDGINLVQITLDASDTYTVKFMRMRGREVHTIAERSGVYNDNLRDVFTSVTGLHTSLGSLSNPEKMVRISTKRPIYTAITEGRSTRYFDPNGREVPKSAVPKSELAKLSRPNPGRARYGKATHDFCQMCGRTSGLKEAPDPSGNIKTLCRDCRVGSQMLLKKRSNPSELLILGANPAEVEEELIEEIPTGAHSLIDQHVQEIDLPSGSTITIRANPLRKNICGARTGGGPCTREPRHKGPHLPQGATMRPRSRLPKAWRPNPSASAIREEFTGTAAESYFVENAPGIPAGDYAQLGELLALYVKPARGGQVQTLDFRGDKVLVICDRSRRQIYFLDGNQDVTPALDLFLDSSEQWGDRPIELGECRRIDYKQRKEHVEHPEIDEWRHAFGEETGGRPKLMFDPVLKQLQLRGGEYEIRREGIVN